MAWVPLNSVELSKGLRIRHCEDGPNDTTGKLEAWDIFGFAKTRYPDFEAVQSEPIAKLETWVND